MRTLKAALPPESSERVYAAAFAGDEVFARFITEFIEHAKETSEQDLDGVMYAWCVKVAQNGHMRKQQYKFMTASLQQVLGPKEWDASTIRRTSDTGVMQ